MTYGLSNTIEIQLHDFINDKCEKPNIDCDSMNLRI